MYKYNYATRLHQRIKHEVLIPSLLCLALRQKTWFSNPRNVKTVKHETEKKLYNELIQNENIIFTFFKCGGISKIIFYSKTKNHFQPFLYHEKLNYLQELLIFFWFLGTFIIHERTYNVSFSQIKIIMTPCQRVIHVSLWNE